MKNIDLTPVIEAIVALLSAIITIFILPKLTKHLKQSLNAEQMSALREWVKIAVAAAEQLYGSKTGQQKKEYVVSFLLSKGIVINIDEVTALIESEVYKLTAEQ
ncbi:MAG: holin [Clostridia bacterium]|nr:holin [Clostridia bacterium]